MVRVFHQAAYHEANPILEPDRAWERQGSVPTAMPFSDGVFWDPRDRLFKMWYMAGYQRATCLATSRDGLSWTKPQLDVVAGTNIVLDEPRDSSTVWLDAVSTDPRARFKMSLFPAGRTTNPLTLYDSPDGIHWRRAGQAGRAGDRTTCFWNPFRQRWVYSIRSGGDVSGDVRHRRYVESASFVAKWDDRQPVPWSRADALDGRRDDTGSPPQLYNLDCVAYESVILGLFSIWRGDFPDRPKHNDVCVGFSRDGFHWDRRNRQPLLPVSEREADWNWGNVQSAGGCCVVVGSKLFFYASGRGGRRSRSEPEVCSTGLAVLRRDGFASMSAAGSAEGTLTTMPMMFSGGHLFVNADTHDGELRVEALDESGQTIPEYARARCVPLRGDTTSRRIAWEARPDVAPLARRPVRFRFFLTRGHLYAFWVSRSTSGASGGYVAAGGPGLPGPVDAPGQPV